MKSTIAFLIVLICTSSFYCKLKKDSSKATEKMTQGELSALATNAVSSTDSQAVFKNLDKVYYIKLANTGENDNFSSYKVPTRKPWGASDVDVKTVWTKLRFDPETLLVHTGDFTFSTSSGICHHSSVNPDKIPFGSAFGCENNNTDDAKAKIDLRGTNFAVDDTFTFRGWNPKGTIKVSSNNQVIEITGGGYCGWTAPTKATGEVEAHTGGWHLRLKVIDSSIFYENGNSYLALKNPNWSSYKLPPRKPWGSNDSDLRTDWTAVRINMDTLTINTSDYSHSTSQGQVSHWPAYNKAVPFGTAFGCENGKADGVARIDLTGTKFAVDDQWIKSGYLPVNKITFSNNNQVVDIFGGGYCGWTVPAKAGSGEESAHKGGDFIKLKILQ